MFIVCCAKEPLTVSEREREGKEVPVQQDTWRLSKLSQRLKIGPNNTNQG